MSRQNKARICFLGVAICFGGFLDTLIKDFPLLTLDPKVGIVDLANLLVTIALTIIIPFLVKRFIEDEREIKGYLIEELKKIIDQVQKIKLIVSSAYSIGTFTQSDRNKINYGFHETELIVVSFCEQLDINFPKEAKKMRSVLNILISNYKDYLTGGELMKNSFIAVSEKFYRENNTKYSQIETRLKTIIQEIHRL